MGFCCGRECGTLGLKCFISQLRCLQSSEGVETTPPGSPPSLNMIAILLFIPVYSVPCWLCVRLGFEAEFCHFLAGPGRVDWAGGRSWQSAVLERRIGGGKWRNLAGEVGRTPRSDSEEAGGSGT